MSLDDLDIEFEEENENKVKKIEAVELDGDLEFHSHDPTPQVSSVNSSLNRGEEARGDKTGSIQMPSLNSSTPRNPEKTSPSMALPRTGNLTSGITPPSSGVVSAPEGAVRKIREVSTAPVASSSTVSLQNVDGTSALKKEVSSKAVPLHPQFQEQLHKIQLESEVRVMVAESKVEFLTEILSDMKLMDHQVGQLLQRILTKYPDTRNEVMMIKKLMNEFVSKKRK